MIVTTKPIEIQTASTAVLSVYLTENAMDGVLTRDEFTKIMNELTLRGEHLEVLARLDRLADPTWR
jgi:hypothetical protein